MCTLISGRYNKINKCSHHSGRGRILCFDLLPLQYTKLTHEIRTFLMYRFLACTDKAATSATASGSSWCWWDSANIFPNRGDTGKLATARPSGVTELVKRSRSASRSGSPGAGAVRRRSSWSRSSAPRSCTPSGGDGNGKLTTLSMFIAFICSRRPSAGFCWISGSEKSFMSLVNTALLYNLNRRELVN